MSLEEFWNAFYDDTAPIFVNKFLTTQGDELLAESKWQDPSNSEKDFLKGAWDYDTIAYRTYDTKMYVDDNPFSDHCFSRMNLLLLEKSDSDIVIKEVVETSGVIYTDRFRMEAKWDIYSPDPKSQQVILRQSYKIQWLTKPFGVWRIIDPLASKKMEKALDKEPAWYRSSSHEYLTGLESGIYELPFEPPYWEVTEEDEQ